MKSIRPRLGGGPGKAICRGGGGLGGGGEEGGADHAAAATRLASAAAPTARRFMLIRRTSCAKLTHAGRRGRASMKKDPRHADDRMISGKLRAKPGRRDAKNTTGSVDGTDYWVA